VSSLTLIGAHRAVSELLENRPESWDVIRFKGLFERLDRRNADLTYEMLSLRSTGEVVSRADMGRRQEPDEASLPRYLVAEIDDLVVNPMWLIGGGIGVSRRAGAVSPDYRVFRSGGALLPQFVHHLLRSQPYLDQYLLYTRAQTTFDRRVQQSDLDNLPLPVPPLDEQRAIANYLDRETVRIDTLIEEQQRLIAMLRERRQAIIDLAFSVLDSRRIQLRRYIRFLTSGSRGWGDYYADEGERFVRIGNLPRASLNLRGDIQFVDLPSDVTEGSRTMLEAGDLLFSITAYLGSVAVVGSDWAGAYVSQHVALCRLEPEDMDSKFIGWFMLSTTGQDQLNEGAAGGAKMQLALDDIRGLRVPLAPVSEQRSIAASLDEKTAEIDRLVAETERFIELARERRSALITAAVTGQIDVREAVA
jgi:type I restriction enzyme S subunit